MISPFDVYLIGIADHVRTFVFGIMIFFIICAAALVINMVCQTNTVDEKKNMEHYFVIDFIIASVFALLLAFLPSSKTLAAMYVIPPVVNNNTVEKIPTAVLRLIESYTKDEK